VNWRSWTQSSANFMVVPVQKKGYEDGIAHLAKWFNPSLGKLHVTVLKATNLPGGFLSSFLASVYANIEVDGQEPLTVKSKERGTSPQFDADPVDLDILQTDCKMAVRVYESHLGADKPVGMASVDVQRDCKDGQPLTKELELEGSDGATLTVKIEMTLKDGDHLLPSEAQESQKRLQHIENLLKDLQTRVLDIYKNVSANEQPVWDYDRKGKLPKCVKGLPASQVLPPHKIGMMIQSVTEYMYTQFGLLTRLPPVSESYERYGMFFQQDSKGYIPKPKLLDNMLWAEDDEFLRQIFAGLNPMQVKVCASIDGMPTQLTSLKAKDGCNVEQLMKDQRLYVLDYVELRNIRGAHDCTLYAPIVLFYRTGAEKLDVLGISLEPCRADAPVYVPGSTVPLKYLLAKIHVQCADNQVHQFNNHLGFAHLAVEPMAVACHNVLEKENHPLGNFLKPHFRDTIGINYLARQTLVSAHGSLTESTFATGTAQGLDMVEKAFESYNFMESGLPGDLLKRGFARSDEFKGYRYRDDGLLIWDALWTLCVDMVEELYQKDEDVVADTVVQAWAVEMASPHRADVKGFPSEISTTEALVKCLTTIIWTASALHSAINYVQYPYTSTPINRPASVYGGVPDGSTDITDADILKAVPGAMPDGIFMCIFQGLMSWLLATPEQPTLDQVTDRTPNRNNPVGLVEFRSKYSKIYNAFDNNLRNIEEMIKQRNEGLVLPYDVLLPSRISASINI